MVHRAARITAGTWANWYVTDAVYGTNLFLLVKRLEGEPWPRQVQQFLYNLPGKFPFGFTVDGDDLP